MPRASRKAPQTPEPVDAVRALVAKPTTKLTKKNLVRFQEKILLENIEPMLTESFAAIRKGISEGNVKMIQLAVEIGGIINTSKTPTIINQVYAKSESNSEAKATSESTAVNGFESLARKLDARDAAIRDGEVVDITIEE